MHWFDFALKISVLKKSLGLVKEPTLEYFLFTKVARILGMY